MNEFNVDSLNKNTRIRCVLHGKKMVSIVKEIKVPYVTNTQYEPIQAMVFEKEHFDAFMTKYKKIK